MSTALEIPHASRDREIRLLPKIQIASATFPLDALPPTLQAHPGIGVVTVRPTEIRSVHLDEFVCHPRAIVAPSGDFLLFHAAGPMHYAWAKKKSRGNQMLVRRSRDRGATWEAPQIAWDVPYSQHAAIPFLPRSGTRLYAFGTEPRHDLFDGGENAAIGYRFSDDDGVTWSAVEFIRPENDPEFQAMSAMRMCETSRGTWLLGSHAGTWKEDDSGVVTHQYLLRTEDQGQSWQLLPGARPQGWQTPGHARMDEGRPILLTDGRIALYGRTPEGHLWTWTSEDDGKTWSDPEPTPLVHLEAPPMVFHLADGKTLVAFIHNRHRVARKHIFAHESRTELWVTLSRDDGQTWSEPRFIIANACQAAELSGWGGTTPMVSYGDLLVDGENLHLFLDHQMRQILHLRFTENDLATLPTAADLSKR